MLEFEKPVTTEFNAVLKSGKNTLMELPGLQYSYYKGKEGSIATYPGHFDWCQDVNFCTRRTTLGSNHYAAATPRHPVTVEYVKDGQKKSFLVSYAWS